MAGGDTATGGLSNGEVASGEWRGAAACCMPADDDDDDDDGEAAEESGEIASGRMIGGLRWICRSEIGGDSSDW